MTSPFPGPAHRRTTLKLTSAQVEEALRRRHPTGEWVCVDEAFSGFASYGTGGIDLLAIGAWKTAKAPGLPGCGKVNRDYRGNDPSDWQEIDARNPLVGYEIKVSRSDFKREIYGYTPGEGASRSSRRVPRWPAKAQFALERVHFFVFATPRGLLFDDEIARREPWGEGEAPRRGALYLPAGVGLVEVDASGCTVRQPAVLRPNPVPWTRHETHELLRRADYRAFARGSASERAA